MVSCPYLVRRMGFEYKFKYKNLRPPRELAMLEVWAKKKQAD